MSVRERERDERLHTGLHSSDVERERKQGGLILLEADYATVWNATGKEREHESEYGRDGRPSSQAGILGAPPAG